MILQYKKLNFQPKRFALKYSPPSIVLECENQKTHKFCLFTMRFNDLKITSV